LPRLAAGEIVGAYALSEASSGSDALNCRARAQLTADGKHYILNGEKMWITNAGFADLFTVFAKIDGEKFTAFLVERIFPGFRSAAKNTSWAFAAHPPAQSFSTTAKCPAENLLGDIGKANHRLQHSEHRPLQAGAMCVGGGPVSLESAISYAKQRKALNKSISEFALVREKICQHATLLYVGESLSTAPSE